MRSPLFLFLKRPDNNFYKSYTTCKFLSQSFGIKQFQRACQSQIYFFIMPMPLHILNNLTPAP